MPELSIVIPAYRERDNVVPMLSALERALQQCDWEAIFVVADAFDGTEDLVRERAPRGATRAYAACTASAGAGSPRHASRACSRARRPTSR